MCMSDFRFEPALIPGAVMSTVAGKHTGAGLVMISIGVPVKELIAKLADKADVHPAELVTVKL